MAKLYQALLDSFSNTDSEYKRNLFFLQWSYKYSFCIQNIRKLLIRNVHESIEMT